ncbi:permease [Radiobacillus deserti]|uniref:Permease n=1 Tax=Radiobacillus deserti TaxID=2594883 RepID=A0A516KDY2_9BACI|nr:permease [Radiobacillus deserti]QDP39611.1 permease [Radiobacillus deserti]
MTFDVLQSFLYISIELTVLFFGISFLVSFLQGIVPYERLEKRLGNSPLLISASFTLFFAFITPFCSCSTIPIVVSFLHKKVRFGIVMIFLFASPVLDPTILTLMAALFGFKVTIVYTITTSILCVLIGLTLERLGFEQEVKQVIMKVDQPSVQRFNVIAALKETIKLMKTVYPFLMIGAGIGAIIHGTIPTEWISNYLGGSQWWLVPIAAIVGIPLYIRLSTMIPISQIMIVKGMALGPVMALMISSAGASLPELTLLNSIFKKKLMLAFIGSVFMMSTISGLLFYAL